ncbi:MAG TPA: anaerobic C4-dicarboxylate transporter family protein, partial [Chitinophagaceae bacterium]|nr:anaerobic C4-dicarboxylate transporter family protein [Chitinophagaceae bacterium]
MLQIAEKILRRNAKYVSILAPFTTVFLTILILFLVGGEVTRGFAFAMLIGVITGIYSSVFVAAPILLDLGSGKSKVAKTQSDTKSSSRPETVKS